MTLLENKVVIITGANSGVGAAAAKIFASEGASVVIGARRTEPLQAVAGEIEKAGGKVLALPLDISKRDSVENMVAETVKTFGKIDVLVNNAAVLDNNFDGIASYQDEEFDRLLSINTKGTMNCIRAVIPKMGEGSAILNVSTIGATKGTSGVMYAASKAAILGVTKHVALCYASKKIRCNAVCPGGIATPMMEGLDYSHMDMSVMGAIGAHTDGNIPASSAEAVANVLLIMASDLAAPITGQVIVSDYGASL